MPFEEEEKEPGDMADAFASWWGVPVAPDMDARGVDGRERVLVVVVVKVLGVGWET